jgi:nitrite reductase (NADH) small subunit
MREQRWIRVTDAHNVPPREGRLVHVDGRAFALFNLGDRFLATSNRCPHRGGPLCDGIVTGHAVVCPLHAWKVNLESGAIERPHASACVETFATRVEDGIVMLAVPVAAAAENVA